MTRSRLLLLIFAVQCFLVPSLCTEYDYDEEIMSQSIPAYAVISGAKYLNSSICKTELEELQEAIDRRLLWGLRGCSRGLVKQLSPNGSLNSYSRVPVLFAMCLYIMKFLGWPSFRLANTFLEYIPVCLRVQVLDTSGKPASGFLTGNNFWLGSQFQCHDITNRKPLVISLKALANNSRYRNVEDEFPPFDLNYFVAYFWHNSTMQYHIRVVNENLISFGICLPTSCTTNEIATIFENIFKNRTLGFTELYSADFMLVEVKDMKDDFSWFISLPYITIWVVIFLTLLLMVVGTFYDILTNRKSKKHKKYHSCENNNTSIQLATKQPDEDPEEQQVNLITQSTLGRIVHAFSVHTNSKRIFTSKLGVDTVPPIHGLRFLGMGWVIMVHTIYYMMDVADNKYAAWRKGEALISQIISNSTYSVDTFFVLSGFLLAHLFFASSEGKEIRRPISYSYEIKLYVMSFLKRFMRLTPAYVMAMGVFEINSAWFVKNSSFYLSERGDQTCSKYWWRNLLYIQNFFGRESMCMSWSWYLADDMQFFLIGTFLLLLSRIYFKFAVVLLSGLLIVTTFVTGYLSLSYEYIPTMDEQYERLHELYDPPWARMGPYLVGIITGYICFKLNKKLKLKKRTLIMFWILGSACNVVILFSITNRQISVISSAFYTALGRTVWGIGIAWIIIACNTNNGGPINQILSWKCWIPFSRLTYCAYLLNPMVITLVYFNSETTVHLDHLHEAVLVFGNVVFSYVCAYLFSLMFEAPYVVLTKQAVSYFSRKK